MSIRSSLLTATVLMLSSTVSAQTVFNPAWPRIGPYSAAEMCLNCHDASDAGVTPAILRSPHPDLPHTPDAEGDNISPIHGQHVGVMGHSFSDPYFIASVEDEASRYPQLAGAIENECLRCHAPMGFDYAHNYAPERLDLLGNYRLETALTEMHAREGVSCTLCHQIQLDPLAELANGTRIVGEDSILFGPIATPDRTRMARYGVEYADAISDASLCGSCHNLFTDVVDPVTGERTGERFLEQGAWFEWNNSAFAGVMACQQCHQATPGEDFQTPVSTYGVSPARPDYSPHLSPGGNTQLLQQLKDFRVPLLLDPRLTDEDFEVAMDGTRALLKQSAAIFLAVDGVGDQLTVDATIQNLTGHKLPTGYPSRRMWLHLKVTDGTGSVAFESGAPDEAGRISSDATEDTPACVVSPKPAGFDTSACYMPHQDVIDDPAQIAVYEPVMGDAYGQISYVLLNGHSYLKDNRIPPVGFTDAGEKYLPATAPVGTAADPDFNVAGSGQDTVHYRMTVDPTLGPYTVESTLYYQSTRPAFVSALTAETSRVDTYRTLYESVPPVPEALATVSASAVLDRVFVDSFETVP